MRLNKSQVKDEFLKEMKEKVPFKEVKEILKKGAKKGEGLYEASGDNRRWHFGEDEGENAQYQAIKDLELSEKDEKKFKEHLDEKYSDYMPEEKHASHDFDTFEKKHKKEYIRDIQKAVDESDDYEQFLEKTENIEEELQNEAMGEDEDYEREIINKAYKDFETKEEKIERLDSGKVSEKEDYGEEDEDVSGEE